MANRQSAPEASRSRLKPLLGITAVVIAALAVAAPYVYSLVAPRLGCSLSAHPISLRLPLHVFRRAGRDTTSADPPSSSPPSSSSQPAAAAAAAPGFTCDPRQGYTAEIVSLDPLLVYIRGFLSAAETAALLRLAAAGSPSGGFRPSEVYKGGRRQGTAGRTSSSAGLPRGDPAVACVLGRAEALAGPALLDRRRGDDAGAPQLVRYRAGQRFDVHHDWYATPRPASAAGNGDGDGHGRRRRWNRVASFFAVLEDGCEGGETWFPHVNASDDAFSIAIATATATATATAAAAASNTTNTNTTTTTTTTTTGEGEDRERGPASRPLCRRHEDGGVAFAPVSGNALFWVNLFPNGTGDLRTLHAGLPVESGTKTAMNIWPRKYYD